MKNKKIIFIGILIIGIVLFSFYYEKKELNNIDEISVGTKPAAPYYCNELGYEWRIENTNTGGQVGICKFLDGSECDDWEFWGGECGEQWSYCTKQGYNQIVKKDIADYFSPRGHIACVDKNTGEEIGLVFDLMNMRQQFQYREIE